MPVLMVSLKTWPHVGFSRKRSIEPSSRAMTMPNSSGFSTWTRPMVANALFSSWNSMMRPRSMSVRTSPEMTRKRSVRCCIALRTEPAVPSGDSSDAYSMCTPNSEPSPKYVRMVLARNATVTTISSMPCRFNRSMTCSIIGRLTSGSMGLGTFDVSGRSRVPSPPAMITAFMSCVRSLSSSGRTYPTAARSRPHVAGCCVSRGATLREAPACPSARRALRRRATARSPGMPAT